MFWMQKKCTRDVILKTFKETNNNKINKFKVLFKLFSFLLFHALPQKIYIIPLHHRAHFLNIYLFSWLFLLLLFWNSHLVTSKLVHFFSTHNKTHEGTHKRMNQKNSKSEILFFWEIQVKMCNEKKQHKLQPVHFFAAAVAADVFYLFHLKCNLTRWFFCGCGSW